MKSSPASTAECRNRSATKWHQSVQATCSALRQSCALLRSHLSHIDDCHAEHDAYGDDRRRGSDTVLVALERFAVRKIWQRRAHGARPTAGHDVNKIDRKST